MNFALTAVLLLSSALAAFGQVLLKLGASQSESILAYVNPYVAGGLAAFIASLVLWLSALSRAPLHIAYTFSMFTFVLVCLASAIVLGERPSMVTVTGWGVICLGVAVVYAGS